MKEIQTTLCAVFTNFDVQLSPPNQKVNPRQDITMRAEPGLFVKVKSIKGVGVLKIIRRWKVKRGKKLRRGQK